MEELLEDYGLGKSMEEVLSIREARKYYSTLKNN